MEIKNAIIKSANIIRNARGHTDVYLMLDYGSTSQGFDTAGTSTAKGSSQFNLTGLCGYFVCRVMEVAGVTAWSQLAGKPIRVKANQSKVHAIGHLIDDDWFDPSADCATVDPASLLSQTDTESICRR